MAKKARQAIRETDMFAPLRDWLEESGYEVHAEVKSCDIAARRGDELVLIEMKRAVSLGLLIQAVRRQEAAESVYVAVPAPGTADKRWRESTRLLKRLELGLIVVHLESALPGAEVVFHPVRQERKRDAGKARAILREMSGRSANLNVGGSTRRSLMTAYREQALTVAAALDTAGATSPAALRKTGCPEKTPAILYDNHYGWFERIANGVYGLTGAGRAALAEHPVLIERIREKTAIRNA